jgi:hypothetical protein
MARPLATYDQAGKSNIIRIKPNTSPVTVVSSLNPAVKCYPPKNMVQQVVVLPGVGNTQKTYTIPASHAHVVNRVQVSSNSSVHQYPSVTSPNRTITIQTFKSATTPSKSPNVLLMPTSRPQVTAVPRSIVTIPQTTRLISKTVTVGQPVPSSSGQKRLSGDEKINMMDSSEPKGKIKIQSPSNPGTVIEIQASGDAFQNLIQNGHVSPDLLELVRRAISDQGEKDKAAGIVKQPVSKSQ